MKGDTYHRGKKTEAQFQALVRRQYTKRGWISLKLDPAQGCIDAGIPDLLMVGHSRQLIFIECKTLEGVLTQIQKHQHQRLRDLGHKVIVASTLTEACAPLHAGENQ